MWIIYEKTRCRRKQLGDFATKFAQLNDDVLFGEFSLANVIFEPGCRNNWHIHHSSKDGGQILLVVEGEGWYQEEGKPAQSLKTGDVVTIPANVKHWHGAKKDCCFSHLAISVPGENTSTEWCEPVLDKEYDKLK